MSKTFAEFLNSKIDKSSKDAFGREQNRLRSIIQYASLYANIANVPDAATLISKLGNAPTVKLSPEIVRSPLDLQTEYDAETRKDKARLEVVEQ